MFSSQSSVLTLSSYAGSSVPTSSQAAAANAPSEHIVYSWNSGAYTAAYGGVYLVRDKLNFLKNTKCVCCERIELDFHSLFSSSSSSQALNRRTLGPTPIDLAQDHDTTMTLTATTAKGNFTCRLKPDPRSGNSSQRKSQ